MHEASLRLLQEVGVEFMGGAARATFAAAGALVDHDTGLVRIPSEVVDHAVATAPSQFVVTPRNPMRRLEVGRRPDRVRARRRASDRLRPRSGPPNGELSRTTSRS